MPKSLLSPLSMSPIGPPVHLCTHLLFSLWASVGLEPGGPGFDSCCSFLVNKLSMSLGGKQNMGHTMRRIMMVWVHKVVCHMTTQTQLTSLTGCDCWDPINVMGSIRVIQMVNASIGPPSWPEGKVVRWGQPEMVILVTHQQNPWGLASPAQPLQPSLLNNYYTISLLS